MTMNTSKKEDNIPQRPFRRLSGSGNSESRILFALREEEVDCNDFDEAADNVIKHKGQPLKKPSHLTSTVFLDDTTMSSSTLMIEDNLATTCANYDIQSASIMREEVEAREQPNNRTPTIPIDLNNSKPFLVRRMEMVEEFWRCMNKRDVEGFRNVCTIDLQLIFRGAQRKISCTMQLEEGLTAVLAVFKSLPDFRFMYSAIEESQHSPGVLVVKQFVGAGNHTGNPLTLPDSNLPPIPTSNRLVVLDECECHFFFHPESNKICRMEEIAMGETTGVFGVYTLLSQS